MRWRDDYRKVFLYEVVLTGSLAGKVVGVAPVVGRVADVGCVETGVVAGKMVADLPIAVAAVVAP